MALIPTRRHVLATTATAILAFMIVVPTVLHVVNPAFGQGTGPQGGYAPPPVINVPPPTPPSPSSSSPQPAPAPSPEPVDTTTPTSEPTPEPSSPTPEPSTEQPAPSEPTPEPTAEPEPTVVSADVGTLTPGTPITIDLSAPTLLEPAAANPLVSGALANTASLTTNTNLVVSLVADPAALQSLVADKGATQALLSSSANVEKILASPAALKAFASDPDAAVALLANADVQAQLEDDPALFQQVASAILDQQHVSSITLTSTAAGSNVQLTVKEYLPNSKDQTAVTPLGDADLAHITLKVAAPKNVGSAPVSGTTAAQASAETVYQALKILDISVSGVPHDSVGATIQFTVTQAELDLMGLAPGDITLLHQVGGAWVELSTKLVSHSGATYTFEAQTPSFSYCAGAGRTAPAGVTAEGMSALAITGIVIAVLAILVVVGVVLARRRQE